MRFNHLPEKKRKYKNKYYIIFRKKKIYIVKIKYCKDHKSQLLDMDMDMDEVITTQKKDFLLFVKE